MDVLQFQSLSTSLLLKLINTIIKKIPLFFFSFCFINSDLVWVSKWSLFLPEEISQPLSGKRIWKSIDYSLKLQQVALSCKIRPWFILLWCENNATDSAVNLKFRPWDELDIKSSLSEWWTYDRSALVVVRSNLFVVQICFLRRSNAFNKILLRHPSHEIFKNHSWSTTVAPGIILLHLLP